MRLVLVDHQTKPEIGQAEAERLITQKNVLALYGAWASGVTAIVSCVAERYGGPMVNGSRRRRRSRARGSSGSFAPRHVRFPPSLQKKRNVKLHTLGLIYEDYGYETVVDVSHRQRATSPQSEVQRLKS